MRFVSVVCIVLGVALLVTGVGMRLLVEGNEEVRAFSEQLERQTGERIRPALAARLLRETFEIEGRQTSLDELLAEESEDFAFFAKALVRLYANANLFAIAGAALLITAKLTNRPAAC